jgi:hypothetical protein
MFEIAWGWITWSWINDLSSMRLCVKCEYDVECDIGWKKDVWKYMCNNMDMVWILWYNENSVVDRW